MGASGDLNYAFHVNHVPHWTHWLGGPPELGTPLHHSELLVEGLPAFAFSAPFDTTYPAYNNLSFWYRGYRHFFSWSNEWAAIMHNTYVLLVRIFYAHPLLKALAITVVGVACVRPWRASARTIVRAAWPLPLLSALNLVTYLLVHVEEKYLVGAFLMVTSLPLALLLDSRIAHRRMLVAGLGALFALGSGRELYRNIRAPISALRRGADFHRDRQWRLAAALGAFGLKAGDAVAVIADDEPVSRCTWAYVTRLRIVAEFGSLPWKTAPYDRVWFEDESHEPGDDNAGKIFWALPTERRTQVTEAFHRVGARAVVSLVAPSSVDAAGWSPIGDTDAWIHIFETVPGA